MNNDKITTAQTQKHKQKAKKFCCFFFSFSFIKLINDGVTPADSAPDLLGVVTTADSCVREVVSDRRAAVDEVWSKVTSSSSSSCAFSLYVC